MKDGRSKTSAENGKKGGRPVATSTLVTQEQRRLFCEWLQQDLTEIYQALAEKAKKGDVAAAKELFDRAWGKPQQSIDHTTKGEKIIAVPPEIGDKHGLYATDPGAEPNSEGHTSV